MCPLINLIQMENIIEGPQGIPGTPGIPGSIGTFCSQEEYDRIINLVNVYHEEMNRKKSFWEKVRLFLSI